MKRYMERVGTPIRLEYGVGLVAGLALFPETAAHAPPMQKVNDELDAAHEARRAYGKQVVGTRVALRFADFEMDRTIRSAAKAAEIHDGGRRGPAFGAIFPEGLGPVVKPDLSRQIPPTEALVERLTKTKASGLDAYRAEWLPKLQDALAKLKKAAEAHAAAKKAHDDAFGTELALREQHSTMVDQIAGHVRAAFPRDREKQDLIFPEVDEKGGSEKDDAKAEKPAAATAGEPAKPATTVPPPSNGKSVVSPSVLPPPNS